MKYLKKMNELFDDEKTRSKFGHDYLTGDLAPEDTLNWKEYDSDVIKNKLLEKVPYLNSLDFRKTGKISQFTFNEYKDGLFLLFDIQVVEFGGGRFMLAVYSKSLVDDKLDWDKDFIKSGKTIKEVIELLNSDVLAMLNSFSEYVKQYDIEIVNKGDIKYDMN